MSIPTTHATLLTSLRNLGVGFKQKSHRLRDRRPTSLLQLAKPGLDEETAQKILTGTTDISNHDLATIVHQMNTWAKEIGMQTHLTLNNILGGTPMPPPAPQKTKAELPPRPVLAPPNNTRKVGAKLYTADAPRPSRFKPKTTRKNVTAVAMAVAPPAQANNINTQTQTQTQPKPEPEYDALVDELARLFIKLGDRQVEALLQARRLLEQAGLPALAGRDHELASAIVLGTRTCK